jgi:flagellum-specific ATP synthase
MSWAEVLARVEIERPMGHVRRVIGLTVEAEGPRAQVGELCTLVLADRRVAAEVVGFRDAMTLLMPFGAVEGLEPGTPVVARRRRLVFPVGEGLLGRILDGLGQPIDNRGPLTNVRYEEFRRQPIDPLGRQPVTEPFQTGVRAIDGLLSLGRGQRVGIFAGSGSGKSTLLGMLARGSEADVHVVLLIGERGREVREFLEHDLGEEGLARSVVVVATADTPALVRIKAAQIGAAIAIALGRQGYRVLLLMDSLTRYAMALREVGLAIGEPPTTRSYTPSVFAELPVFVEQAGNLTEGSVTAVYTVLLEGDDVDDPLADTARSLLDGHILLSRRLLAEGRYPPIDVVGSLSRVRPRVLDDAAREDSEELRRALAALAESYDMRSLGLYRPGHNPYLDHVLALEGEISAWLQQANREQSSWEETWRTLHLLAERVRST